MIEHAINLSERIEKGIKYLKNANDKDFNKFKPVFDNLLYEYEELVKAIDDEDIKALLTRIFVLSIKEME